MLAHFHMYEYICINGAINMFKLSYSYKSPKAMQRYGTKYTLIYQNRKIMKILIREMIIWT